MTRTRQRGIGYTIMMMISFGCGSKSTNQEALRGPPGQSFHEAMRIICDVDRLANINAEENLLEAAQKRSDWLRDHIKNPDAIYLRTIWTVEPAEQRARGMRAEAEKVGILRCALADRLEEEGDL